MSVLGTWAYNASVEEIRAQYDFVSKLTQMLRDITPGSGAYFVGRAICLFFIRVTGCVVI